MPYTALIGQPTGHSVSPVLYETLAQIAGIPDYRHIKIDIDIFNLGIALNAAKTLHFAGLNITLPYKVEVIKHLTTVDRSVTAIGAVNTVKICGDKTTGFNTDWIGIATSIKRATHQKAFRAAAIFGHGGAARAAIHAMRELDVSEINVISRTDDPISILDDIGITRVSDYSHVRSLIQNAQLIVNATPTGMCGNDPAPFDLRELDGVSCKGKVFLDAVFNPLDTPLIQKFQSRGAKTIDGLWLMIFQGIEAFKIWTELDLKVAEEDLQTLHVTLTRELT